MLNFSPESFSSYLVKNKNQKNCYSSTPENIIRINPTFANIERFQLYSTVDKTWKGIIRGGVFFFPTISTLSIFNCELQWKLTEILQKYH